MEAIDQKLTLRPSEKTAFSLKTDEKLINLHFVIKGNTKSVNPPISIGILLFHQQ